MDALMQFMASKSVWVYVAIFLTETFYTALSTLRVVMMNKGEKVISSILSFFEILIWVVVTGTVLGSVTSDPLKIVVYAVAYALGIFLGSIVEKKLALGTISLSVFLPDDETVQPIIDALKENGYGATILDATGIRYAHRKVLIIVAKRKDERAVMDLIHSKTQNAVISVSAVASINGGYVYGHRKRNIFSFPRIH